MESQGDELSRVQREQLQNPIALSHDVLVSNLGECELMPYTVRSMSPYASPAFLVKKKEPRKFRSVLDYRLLNKKIAIDPLPMPNTGIIFQYLSEASWEMNYNTSFNQQQVQYAGGLQDGPITAERMNKCIYFRPDSFSLLSPISERIFTLKLKGALCDIRPASAHYNGRCPIHGVHRTARGALMENIGNPEVVNSNCEFCLQLRKAFIKGAMNAGGKTMLVSDVTGRDQEISQDHWIVTLNLPALCPNPGVSMEQRRNERTREAEDPLGNPPTNGIVLHDSHMQKIRVSMDEMRGCMCQAELTAPPESRLRQTEGRMSTRAGDKRVNGKLNYRNRGSLEQSARRRILAIMMAPRELLSVRIKLFQVLLAHKDAPVVIEASLELTVSFKPPFRNLPSGLNASGTGNLLMVLHKRSLCNFCSTLDVAGYMLLSDLPLKGKRRYQGETAVEREREREREKEIFLKMETLRWRRCLEGRGKSREAGVCAFPQGRDATELPFSLYSLGFSGEIARPDARLPAFHYLVTFVFRVTF
ncbi:hypothetical protein PR048_026118 [Dryococelus australis]|uniref:Uncharacterized protein n=1 Tax=Dryococelus australis TaxID=614101 RepID=A0ABQ9GKI3_9NEOP|nr:hypothetical protein PR048_026118 [Dryococelus australis]